MKIRKSTGNSMLVMSGVGAVLYVTNLLIGGGTPLTDTLLVITAFLLLAGLYISVNGADKTDGPADVR